MHQAAVVVSCFLLASTAFGQWSTDALSVARGRLAATTVGKIVLCTAVAAASVGGVYATTERIDLPEHIDPPSADATPAPAPNNPKIAIKVIAMNFMIPS